MPGLARIDAIPADAFSILLGGEIEAQLLTDMSSQEAAY